jgi:hypothetical protein
MATLISILTGIGLKLLSSAVIEPALLVAVRHLAKQTDSTVDDELVAIIEKNLNSGK